MPYIWDRMKKALAFLVLLVHMNTSMLLPQMPELDIYDASGEKQDDINSVVEYIRSAFGYDNTSDDEDDDNGQTFHIAKTFGYYFVQPVTIAQERKLAKRNIRYFTEYKPGKIKVIPIDIITPPPDACRPS